MLTHNASFYNTKNLNDTHRILSRRKGQTCCILLTAIGMYFLEVLLYYHVANFTDQTMLMLTDSFSQLIT
jgi:hypothetical protein